MQWKFCFYLISLALPLSAAAQKNANKITTDGRQLALLNENINSGKVIIQPGIKIVTPDTLLIHSKKQALLVSVAETTGELDSGLVKYKPVPLIGELNYFGNRNDYLINYCTSYINNFGGSLASIQGKKETFQTIETILAEHHIPKELEYLAVIESGLNGNARSPVGAVGYWQFMRGTAKRMGLVVNRHRDDRKDLYKSTEAAAKHLSYLYSNLDDWLLVIAAYNCGLGRVEDAIRDAGGSKNFWDIKKFLPKETQNHVLAFVSTATIMEKLGSYMKPGLPANFNWASLDYTPASEIALNTKAKPSEPPLVKRFGIDEVKKMALVRIKKPLNLEVVAAVLGESSREIEKWNYDFYDYKANYEPGEDYNLRIPKDKLSIFIAKRDYIQSASDKLDN